VSFHIVELSEVADLVQVVELFSQVWGAPDEPLINSNTLRALAHSGNYVAGAKSKERLIGAVMGWLGGRPPGELHLHSHILAVVPETEARGLGFALKQHQRGWCMARGIPTVEWTFDPLVRRNAYFNLTKLGAEASSYLVNFYGPMEDGINAGDDSDRILVTWNLQSAQAEAAAQGKAEEPDAGRLMDEGAVAALMAGAGDEPIRRDLETGAIGLCQVPADIVAIRRDRPDLARSWRLAVRDALGGALSRGYRVAAATKNGWYVLSPDPN